MVLVRLNGGPLDGRMYDLIWCPPVLRLPLPVENKIPKLIHADKPLTSKREIQIATYLRHPRYPTEYLYESQRP
jgi:hypothetical protein